MAVFREEEDEDEELVSTNSGIIWTRKLKPTRKVPLVNTITQLNAQLDSNIIQIRTTNSN